jgi:HAD superfamily hydrolase (TIGR01549 family)
MLPDGKEGDRIGGETMPGIEAVLFDMDGVIIDSSLDLKKIKMTVFGTPDIFVIEGINALPEEQRTTAWSKVSAMEVEAAHTAVINPEAARLFDWLDAHGIKRGIVTRNGREAMQVIMERIGRDLGEVITREDAEPKPSPEGVQLAMRRLGVNPESTMMVGDFVFDIEAGRCAGCRTIFLRTPKFANMEVDADHEIKSLMEIPGIIGSIIDA